MDTDTVLDKLKNGFNLSLKKVLILKTLRKKELNADELSRLTNIPLGRIYTYLNELEKEGLVAKTSKKPYLYSIESLRNNVIGFMKRRIDGLIHSETEIMDLMQAGHQESIDMVENKDTYTMTHVRFLQECKTMTSISAHGSFPFLLYPRKLSSFVKLRQLITSKRATMCETDYETCMLIFRSYMDSFKKGVKFRLLFERSCFFNHINLIEEHLGEKFLKDFLNDMMVKIKETGMEVYVCDEHLPTQIDICDKKVAVTLRHLETLTGMIITSPRVTEMYNTLFDQKTSRSRLLIPYLEKMLAE